MARMKRYMHWVTYATPIAAVGTAYATGKAATIALGMFPPGSSFLGRLQSIIYHFSSLAGGAAAVTVRMTSDTAGDVMLLPDTTATITTGVTTATDGSAAYSVDLDAGLDSGDTVYMMHKVNAGTATIDKIEIVWEE